MIQPGWLPTCFWCNNLFIPIRHDSNSAVWSASPRDKCSLYQVPQLAVKDGHATLIDHIIHTHETLPTR